jgi:proteasome accessory factor A
MHYLLFLASFQVASIVLTGAGKLGTEDGSAGVRYQISARADFFEMLAGVQTTIRRPICNTRDEALVGPLIAAHPDDPALARVHVIFFDNTLTHTASVLKVGMMQIVLAMLEQGCVPARLLLDDPVQAVRHWSRDPELRATAPLIDGTRYTAAELLGAVYDEAKKFVDAGRAEGIVPDAGRIMSIWGDCLAKLRDRDFAALASRVDWIARLSLLERAAGKHQLSWDSPQLKYLDHLYSSLDPREGLYWSLERAGAVEKLVTDAQIERFAHEPPADTRAWLRSHVLRHAPPGLLDDVDWDMLRLRVEDERFPSGWVYYRYPTLHMPGPHRFTRGECERVLRSAPSLLEGLYALGLGADFSNQENSHGNATAASSHDRPTR